MAKSYDFGKLAEKMTEDYLISKKYEILERNWRYARLEVDLIVQKDDFLIIIEVKARQNKDLNFEEIVTLQKQKNLITAAEKYLEKNDLDLEVRFDVVFIYKINNQYQLEHIENAFYSTLE